VNEKSAWATLESFLGGRAKKYSGGISSPNTAFENGSRLSVHLTWGTIRSSVGYGRACSQSGL
jgi:deoxyribodipyrimidine photo-lyase